MANGGVQIPVNVTTQPGSLQPLTTDLQQVVDLLQQVVNGFGNLSNQLQNVSGRGAGSGMNASGAPYGYGSLAHAITGSLVGAMGVGGASLGFGAIYGGMNQGLANEWQLADIGRRMRDNAQSQREWNDQIYAMGQAMRMTREETVALYDQMSRLYGTDSAAQGAIKVFGSLGRGYGLDPAMVAGAASPLVQAGALGGSGMREQDFAIMIGEQVAGAQMRGRMGEVLSGIAMLTSSVANRMPDGLNLAGISAYTADLNSTGIRGLQGDRGAALLGQIDSSIAGGGDMNQQLFLSRAAQRFAPGINFYQFQKLRAEGLNNPNWLGAVFDQAVSENGGPGANDDRLDFMLSQRLGVGVLQAQSLRRHYLRNGSFQVNDFNKLRNLVSSNGGDLNSLSGSQINLLSELAYGGDQGAIARQFQEQGGTLGKGQTLAQAILGAGNLGNKEDHERQVRVDLQDNMEKLGLTVRDLNTGMQQLLGTIAGGASHLGPVGAIGLGVGSGLFGSLTGWGMMRLGGMAASGVAGLFGGGGASAAAGGAASAATAIGGGSAALGALGLGGAAAGAGLLALLAGNDVIHGIGEIGGAHSLGDRATAVSHLMSPMLMSNPATMGIWAANKAFGWMSGSGGATPADPKQAIKEGVKEGIKEAQRESQPTGPQSSGTVVPMFDSNGQYIGSTTVPLGSPAAGGGGGGYYGGIGGGGGYFGGGGGGSNLSGPGSAFQSPVMGGGSGPRTFNRGSALTGPSKAAGDKILSDQAIDQVVVGGVQTDGYHGDRTGSTGLHYGVDIAPPKGQESIMYATPVIAPEDGRVKDIISSPAFGNAILIDSPSGEWYFGHIQKALVGKGADVRKGQAIALMGNTGAAGIGKHVHVQHRPKPGATPDDPTNLLENQANGSSAATGASSTVAGRYDPNKIDALLKQKPGNPLVGLGRVFAEMSAKTGVPAELALAMFAHESSWGTAGAAVANRNPGNLEFATWEQQSYGAKQNGRWGQFPTWEAGVRAWYDLVHGTYKIGNGGSIDQMIGAYAPPSENDTRGYIDSVHKLMGQWGGQISARGGFGFVPFDGMPANLHRGEMVLPADIAQHVRDGAARGGTQGVTGEVWINLRYPDGAVERRRIDLYPGTPQPRGGRWG